MGRKTAANSVIERNSQGIVEDTTPERALVELFGTLSSLKLYIDKVPPVSVRDQEGNGFDFKPDYRIRGTNILLHVDGDYHETPKQENKDSWKDELLNKAGWRNLHIRADLLTTKRYWAYVGIHIWLFNSFPGYFLRNVYLYA